MGNFLKGVIKTFIGDAWLNDIIAIILLILAGISFIGIIVISTQF